VAALRPQINGAACLVGRALDLSGIADHHLDANADQVTDMGEEKCRLGSAEA
jgi:hypothetical protein